MRFEERALGRGIEGTGHAFGLVEAGAGEILRDTHQEITRLRDVEARAEDRFQRLVLLVGGDGCEQFGVPHLDPALIQGKFHGFREVGQRKAAIKLGLGPAKAPGGLGAVVMASGEDTDSLAWGKWISIDW
ncbi:hypothetical protein A8G00_18215 [Sphingobium sp. SA916]|nr:hypothetical protein A8G00_18215 [Sphingobium sp. SA916]